MGLTDKHMAYGDDIELGKKWSFYNEGYENGKACASFERKKGKWIEWRCRILWWECSECGCGVLNRTNFCPNCGVDMRER